jgi:hypothetical protein
MPNDHTETERKLEKLAERLHDGWAKLHPVTEKELAGVHQAVREQWEKEQKIEKSMAEAKEPKKSAGEKSVSQPVVEKKNEGDQGGKSQSDGHTHRNCH